MVAAVVQKALFASVGGFSMEDLSRRLDEQDNAITGARGDITILGVAVQRVETLLKGMVAVLGTEEEDGKGGYTGTGIVGRTRRNEADVRALKALYHRWIAFGAGFCACLGGSAVLVWYVIGDKIAIVLKGTGHG